jgi:hypothetical protein
MIAIEALGAALPVPLDEIAIQQRGRDIALVQGPRPARAGFAVRCDAVGRRGALVWGRHQRSCASSRADRDGTAVSIMRSIQSPKRMNFRLCADEQ